MVDIKLDVDNETWTRLMDVALRERRPMPWQAEVILRRALGLPVPIPQESDRRREEEGAKAGTPGGAGQKQNKKCQKKKKNTEKKTQRRR